jgi:protein O-GlcNAc transferase
MVLLSLLVLVSLLVLALGGCSSLPRSQPPPTQTSLQADRHRELGLMHYRQGRYAHAEVFFKRALAVQAAVDRRPGVVEMLASLGRVRLALADLDGAEARFREALAASQGLLRPDLAAQALGGLGAVALAREEPQEAVAWFEQALALPLADPGVERAVLLHDLGAAHRQLQDDVTAQARFEAALSMHEALDDRAGIATACHSLASLLADAGRYPEALPLAHRALLLDKSLEIPQAVAQDLALLGRLTAATGQVDQARQYYQRAGLAWRALGRTDAAAAVAARLHELASAAP